MDESSFKPGIRNRKVKEKYLSRDKQLRTAGEIKWLQKIKENKNKTKKIFSKNADINNGSLQYTANIAWPETCMKFQII